MSKREKIILIVLTVAVLFGGYTYFFQSSKTAKGPVVPKASVAELNTFVLETAKNLMGFDLSKAEAHAIARAEALWVRDIYLSGKDLEEEELLLGVSFIYSGYLEIGSRKMAVVNGLEYKEGDEIEPGGYIVRSIQPNKVVIEVKGKKQKTVVPLIDE